LRFVLTVLDDPRQAGRIINHDLFTVLTPNSPLCRFLVEAFNVRLSEQQSFDLAHLVGRSFQARFDKGAEGCFQAMVAVRPCNKDTQTDPVNKGGAKQEDTHGLG